MNGEIDSLQRNTYAHRDDEYFYLKILNLHNQNEEKGFVGLKVMGIKSSYRSTPGHDFESIQYSHLAAFLAPLSILFTIPGIATVTSHPAIGC